MALSLLSSSPVTSTTPRPVVYETTIPSSLPFKQDVTPRMFSILARAFRRRGERLTHREIAGRLNIDWDDRNLRAALKECEARGYLKFRVVWCEDGEQRKLYHRALGGEYQQVVESMDLDPASATYRVFLALQTYDEEHFGQCPTYVQLARRLGAHASTISLAIKALCEKGLIVRPPNRTWATDWEPAANLEVRNTCPFVHLVLCDPRRLPRDPRAARRREIVVEVQPTAPDAASVAGVVPTSTAAPTTSPSPTQTEMPPQASEPTVNKPSDFLKKAVATATKPVTPPTRDATRREAHEAYTAFRQEPKPLDSFPIEQATLIILGRFVALASHLAGRVQRVDHSALLGLYEVLQWLQTIEPQEDDEYRSYYLKKWIDGKPFEFAFNAVTALFSAAFTGFTYDPHVLFRPGPAGNFDRFCIDSLRKLKEGQCLMKEGKPSTLLGASLSRVETMLSSELKKAGAPAAVSAVKKDPRHSEENMRALRWFFNLRQERGEYEAWVKDATGAGIAIDHFGPWKGSIPASVSCASAAQIPTPIVGLVPRTLEVVHREMFELRRGRGGSYEYDLWVKYAAYYGFAVDRFGPWEN